MAVNAHQGEDEGDNANAACYNARWKGGEGERGDARAHHDKRWGVQGHPPKHNNQITMTTAAADMLVAMARKTTATAMMAMAMTSTVTTATVTTTIMTTTVAAAKKTTTTYGDGDDVYDGDGRRRRWRQ